jgi:allantoicase
MGRAGAEVDLASVENGGAVVGASDMFFGSRHNLVMPGRSVNMGDGWETKRSRRDGFDWAVVRLAAEGVISRVEIDTNHFKGNAPESASIEVCDGDDFERGAWVEIVPRAKLQPHTRHFFEIADEAKATHARLRIWPDGGVSRLRLYGAVTLAGRTRFGLRRLAALTADEAERELLACCGSLAWAKAVVAKRPFLSLEALVSASDAAWEALGVDEKLEAFRAHPRIGERHAAVEHGATSRTWAEAEQARVVDAEQATRDALATENRAYEAKFGHVFLICATGKSADEMLAALRARMGHDREAEIRVAADEQRKITRLRLEKLVTR